MPKSENLTNCPRCQHIKDDNVRCGSPAVHGKSLCYFHDRQRQTFPNRRRRRPAQFSRRADFFNVQTPDDVMRSINRVMNAVLSHQLSHDEANSILFALQTASAFAPHTTAAKKQQNREMMSRTRGAKQEPEMMSSALGAAPFPNGEGALTQQKMPRVPHSFAQRKGGAFDFSFPDNLPEIPSSHWPPKSVDDLFEMFPEFEDLKAMLTPEEIAFLDSTRK